MKNIALTDDEIKYLLACIDTHVKTIGVNAAGNAFYMANKLDCLLKEQSNLEDENNLKEV